MSREFTLRDYILAQLRPRFLALVAAVAIIGCVSYLAANYQSNRHTLERSLEVSRQVLTQALSAGDPNLATVYLRSTIEQENFYRVELRDRSSGAVLIGPLSSSSLRAWEICSSKDLGTRFGVEVAGCRRLVGSPELVAGAFFLAALLIVLMAGIQLIRQGLSKWSQDLSAVLDKLSKLGPEQLVEGAVEREDGIAQARELAELQRRVVGILADSKKLIEYTARSKMAAQVAHDIQSPLAALEGAVEHLGGAAEDVLALVMNAVGRIRGIANDLRANELPGVRRIADADSAMAVGDVVERLMAEKRAQYRTMTGLALGLGPLPSPAECRVRADSREFSRVLSNLIDNAVEALIDGRGPVDVSVAALGSHVEILVADEGRGIPAEVLPRLTLEGATFGKNGGSGLGLFHARQKIESWGGRLFIEPGSSTGTRVRVVLPRVAAPDAAPDVALIDDDPLVRASWSIAARRVGKSFRAYASGEEILADLDRGGIPKTTRIYVDSELGAGVKGENLSRDIASRGWEDVWLATGHAPGGFAALPHLRGIVGKEPPWGDS